MESTYDRMQKALNILQAGEENECRQSLEQFKADLDYLHMKVTSLYITALEHGEDPDISGNFSNRLYTIEAMSNRIGKAVNLLQF